MFLIRFWSCWKRRFPFRTRDNGFPYGSGRRHAVREGSSRLGSMRLLSYMGGGCFAINSPRCFIHEIYTMSQSSPTRSSEKVLHPFGGCNRLLGHYRTIGVELLALEARGGIGSFREGVSFVPVEVLESYLEDLLDLDVKEDGLFIVRERSRIHSLYLPLLGIALALSGGLYLVSSGASEFVSLGLTASIALPFAVLSHFFPRNGLMRRMNFAQTLSGEISRRRGRDKDSPSWPTTPLFLRDVLNPSKAGGLQGAAKKMFH